METQVVVMAYEKATKNKFVYAADNSSGPPVLQSLYVEKYVLGSSPPSRLKVTIEAA